MWSQGDWDDEKIDPPSAPSGGLKHCEILLKECSRDVRTTLPELRELLSKLLRENDVSEE